MSASVEKLRAARELIARPGGWMKEYFCRWDNGEVAEAAFEISKDAVCFCAEGAMYAVGVSLSLADEEPEFIFFTRAAGINKFGIPTWNDAPDRTQEEVVATFDRAIALAEAEASS